VLLLYPVGDVGGRIGVPRDWTKLSPIFCGSRRTSHGLWLCRDGTLCVRAIRDGKFPSRRAASSPRHRDNPCVDGGLRRGQCTNIRDVSSGFWCSTTVHGSKVDRECTPRIERVCK